MEKGDDLDSRNIIILIYRGYRRGHARTSQSGRAVSVKPRTVSRAFPLRTVDAGGIQAAGGDALFVFLYAFRYGTLPS